MKVLFVQKVGGVAGSEKYWMNILPSLKNHGVEVAFLSIVHPNDYEAIEGIRTHMKAEDIPYHELSYRYPNLYFFRKLHKLIKREKFDIVHTHLLKTDVLLALYKILFNRKMTLVSTKHGYEEKYINDHGFDPSKRRFNRYYLAARFAERQMKSSFAITHGLYNLYTGLGICKKENLSVIHYGFDFKDYPSRNSEYRFSDIQLVIVGRFTEFKGHRYAFESLQHLEKKYPNIKLILVGFGHLEQELRNQVKDMDLEDHVYFAGHQTNAQDYMRNSDVVLVPSVSEGFGIVILEAFASKTPVVAFDVPAPNEIIESGETGILIPPFDTQTMADEIGRLIQDNEYSKQIADNAYGKLKDYFTLERMTSETISFYKTLRS